MTDANSTADMHFTMGEPVPVGEPMLDGQGEEIGTVVSCTDACGEAFHVVVRPLEPN